MELKGVKVFTPAEEAVKRDQLFKEHFDRYPFTTRCDPVEAAFPYSVYIKPYLSNTQLLVRKRMKLHGMPP